MKVYGRKRKKQKRYGLEAKLMMFEIIKVDGNERKL